MRKLFIVIVLMLVTGCASTRDWYENNIDPIDQPPQGEMIKGLMASDFFQMKDITNKRDELWKLRDEGYNTIYCPIDLPIRHNDVNNDKVRPHINAGRTTTTITDTTKKNIEYVYKKGFRIMVVMGNEPSVRGNLSVNMSGLAFLPLNKNQLYTQVLLLNEMHCWNSLYDNSGKYIFGMMLYLEPSRSDSINFCRQLAQHMRNTGFDGRIYSNGIGDGKWKGDTALDVRYSRSLNTLDAWMKSDNALRNADGMDINEFNAATLIPQLVGHPGSDGWMLYFNGYKGNPNGETPLPDYVWKYLP